MFLITAFFTALNIAAMNYFKFEHCFKLLTLFYKISTSYSCKITDCLSVLHLCMCAGFSSNLADVPILEITKRELVFGAYLIWNRLPYVSVFAHE